MGEEKKELVVNVGPLEVIRAAARAISHRPVSPPPLPSLPPITIQNKTGQVRLGNNTGQGPTLQQLLDWSYHLLTTDSLLS